ncbi:MAG: glycosyltransferase [Planctomycetes bacterium]|nr:glycosyltransferase [Planctomycetota bacterium]
MLPFRVGLDVWPALRHPPGIGRWVRELVRALAPLDERPELCLFDVGPGRAELSESAWALAGRPGVHRVRANVPRGLVAWTGRLGFGAERWLGGVDLFQRTFAASPRVGRVPQVVPVFELHARGSASERELATALAAGGAALVASTWSALEVRDRFGLAAERVHLVPVGCDHWRRDLGHAPTPVEPARIVVLGAVTAHRSPLAIVAAVAELVRDGRELELVFCGRRGDRSDELARAGTSLGARLRAIETPIERELPELVGGASLLVHLNDEECTAVTPLEALSLGVGVVATSLAPFVEALGEHARYVPRDVEARELARALADELERARDPVARAARVAHAAAFTWDRNARATVEVWRRVLGR